jgi:GNAT superfamily N-acetyltransferase
MITLVRTGSDDPDLLNLVKRLDAELIIRNGDAQPYYSQFNRLDKIKHAVVAYDDGVPSGCGAIKQYSADTMEIKRMFVDPAHRRKGIAESIVKELEKWTEELGFLRCILESSINQQEAIALYRKKGFTQIPNFDQYIGIETSICLEKNLNKK